MNYVRGGVSENHPGMLLKFQALKDMVDDPGRYPENCTIILSRACPNIGDEDPPASAALTFTGR